MLEDDNQWVVMRRRRGKQDAYPYTSPISKQLARRLAQQLSVKYADYVFTIEEYSDQIEADARMAIGSLSLDAGKILPGTLHADQLAKGGPIMPRPGLGRGFDW